MLNFEIQLSILKSISATYADEKRVEISSKQFEVDQDTFVYNMVYLKKEKLTQAKKAMRQFIANFLSEFEAKPGEGDETYQLNTQLFKLSK